MSKRGFRAWLRALKVPYLEIGSNRYIDLLSFQIALRAILRVGRPNFHAPGCESIEKGRKLSGVTELEGEALDKDLHKVICELLAARKMTSLTTSHVVSAAKKAADRMALAGYCELPEEEQARFARAAVASHARGMVPTPEGVDAAPHK